jgi:hypothetical protein
MIQAVAPFYEEVNVLEMEPEILPDVTSSRGLSTSGLFLPCNGAFLSTILAI